MLVLLCNKGKHIPMKTPVSETVKILDNREESGISKHKFMTKFISIIPLIIDNVFLYIDVLAI